MASKTEPKTVAELFSVRQISPDTYVSIHNQRPMGNKQPIAFGGGTMGCAVTSAYASLPTTGTYHAYSIQGNFLGPTFIDRPLKCKVTKLRDTRTFATRQVLVYQEQDGNKGDRICLNLVADFQTHEPATVMKFSTTPTRDWGPPELAKTWYQRRAELLKDGKMTEAEVKFSEKMFSLAATFFDCRHAPNSFMGESMLGFVKDVKTDQDSLSLTERVSADWVRIPHKLGPESEHVAGLVAMMDMAMSFLPLVSSFSHTEAVLIFERHILGNS